LTTPSQNFPLVAKGKVRKSLAFSKGGLLLST